METKILIVEDDPTLAETLQYNLERQGYQLFVAMHGQTALDLAKAHRPDLIILDVMLPGIDGFEICRILRRDSNAPILMLTARSDETDKIIGLEVGADDYLTKPFSMRELVARIKAQLRRVRLMREEVSNEALFLPPPQSSLSFGNMKIDLNRRELFLDGERVHIKPKEYDLLLFLVRNRGLSLSRDLILERVWGWTDDNSRTVDVHVRWLREKIEPDPTNALRIITVRGIGYRFEG